MQVFRPVTRNPQITVTHEAPGRFVVRDGAEVITSRAFYASAVTAAVVYASPTAPIQEISAHVAKEDRRLARM